MKSEILIVGGGIIGLTIAREIAFSFPKKRIILIEKEKEVAMHSSSRNSGVIHSTFHLKPNSLKAKFCYEGSKILINYCIKNKIPLKKVGKFVVALNEEERKIIKIYEKWGKENKDDVKIIDYENFKKYEPYANCIEAIYSKNAAIVDSKALNLSITKEIERLENLKILRNCKFLYAKKYKFIEVQTSRGIIKTNFLINSAGLYADKIAHSFGFGRDYIIVPFRGDYVQIDKKFSYLINTMIYRTPNIKFPFLGIHFTKRVTNDIILGPNASLSFGKENYKIYDINILEFFETIFKINFLKLIFNKDFLSIAFKEIKKSLNIKKFIDEAKLIVPYLNKSMIKRGFSGIRAQLVNKEGKLVEDFIIEYDDFSLHILNTVSPGLTSSFAFASYIKNLLVKNNLI